jgi:hypothetical protein
MSLPEPWLRGSIPDVPPLIVPVLHSYLQVREDLQHHVGGLDAAAVWCVLDQASIGFHLKHMAGSVDRLTTYLMGDALSTSQIEALSAEHEGLEDADTLIQHVTRALDASEGALRNLSPDVIYESRQVGRKALPTTVLGLLVHLAEHTQRHLGQVIILAKLARQSV